MMTDGYSKKVMREGRATVLLALPLVAGQVSQMLMGVADTLMIGRLGTVPLAASTFANTVLHVPLMFGIGMAIAVSVKVSQARGAESPVAARAALRHGLFIGLGLGLLTLLAAFLLLPIFPYFGQVPEVVERVPAYFILVALSMTPAMGAMAVKSHADAMNRPWPAFYILLAGVLLNVLLNWVLIYGNAGMPALGLEGAGIATLIARLATLAALLVWYLRSRRMREWIPHRWLVRPDWGAMRDLWKIGWPASLHISAEMGAFILATIMIGSLGAAALASHQVAMSCAATVFMIPLGISMALTVRIGEAWGAKEYHRWRPIVVSGWLMGGAISVVSVTVFLLFREEIAGWFLSDPAALKVAAGLLGVAAVFQVVDHSQIISSGVLRGLDDVRVPARLVFVAFWVVAMPFGWVLSFRAGMGVSGMWWALTTGLTITAVLLGVRVWRKTGQILG
jgi:MATE family multidrug resistance protein